LHAAAILRRDGAVTILFFGWGAARGQTGSRSRVSEDKQALLISRGAAVGDLYHSIHHNDDEEHGRPHYSHQQHEDDRHHFEHADGVEETSPLHTSDAVVNGDTT
jgi:hypothetical protein